MTTQTPLYDADRLQAIRGAMDPLAIIGVFLYYVTKDVTGVQFSQDTLLWFVAAASAVRTMMSQSIERMLAARKATIEHERLIELARLNQAAVSAAVMAGAAAQRASDAVAAISLGTIGPDTSCIGESQIEIG